MAALASAHRRAVHHRTRFSQQWHERGRRVSRRPVHGLWRYVWHGDLGTLLTAPVIYSLLLPVALLDAWLWVFQRICFPAFGLTMVRRRDYVLLDRHRLPYLNLLERLNCVYCGYVNGVFGLAREIAARTEQYWCPIRHARTPADPHRLYDAFVPHGDAGAFASLTARQWRQRQVRRTAGRGRSPRGAPIDHATPGPSHGRSS